MAYDYAKVAQEAARVKQRDEGREGNDKEFKYKLVYPSQGKLKFRILFNPKSGMVGRLVTRHKIEGKQILCASTYSSREDCPICKILKDIENLGKPIPREYWAKTRGLFLAQYSSSEYEIEGLEKGDIFILMVPYTVYKSINKWIADFSNDPSIMAKVFGSHEYFVQVIEKGKEATDWSFRPDSNITIESTKSDEEFSVLLEGLDSLYDLCGFHEKITPEEVALMQTTAASLNDVFISGNVAQKGYTPPSPPKEDKQESKVDPTSASSGSAATQESTSDKPTCWGDFTGPDHPEAQGAKKGNVTRCKYCPVKDPCQSYSKNV